MLSNHANSVGDGILGGVNFNGLLCDFDDPRIRSVETVEDAHKGCLARAVLTEQRMNFAFA